MRLLVALAAVALLLAGCGVSGSTSYEIKITGTSGTAFRGNYMSVENGSSTSKTVDGTVPTSYSVTGSMVSVAFQKKTESGELKVQILKDGKVVTESSTTAPYGVCSVATQ